MSDSPQKSGPGAAARRTIDFERGIPFLVSALGNKLAAAASADLRERLGIGLMEWRIVALLAVEREATPARLGKVTGVDKSVVSRAASSLERRGLITVAADPSAARQTRLALTGEGEAMHDRGIGMAFDRNDQLLHGFTPEERETLSELLRRATANLTRMESKRES